MNVDIKTSVDVITGTLRAEVWLIQRASSMLIAELAVSLEQENVARALIFHGWTPPAKKEAEADAPLG